LISTRILSGFKNLDEAYQDWLITREACLVPLDDKDTMEVFRLHYLGGDRNVDGIVWKRKIDREDEGLCTSQDDVMRMPVVVEEEKGDVNDETPDDTTAAKSADAKLDTMDENVDAPVPSAHEHELTERIDQENPKDESPPKQITTTEEGEEGSRILSQTKSQIHDVALQPDNSNIFTSVGAAIIPPKSDSDTSDSNKKDTLLTTTPHPAIALKEENTLPTTCDNVASLPPKTENSNKLQDGSLVEGLSMS